jgi:signal transduction histidine kinase
VESDSVKREGFRYIWFIASAIVLVALLLLARSHDYLLFHASAEIFSSIVAFTIFALAWHTRRFQENDFLLFLGVAYLFVAGLDIIHMLSYSGMSFFQEYGSNLPTQLWLAARYLQAASLLIAPLFLTRKLKLKLDVTIYAAVSALLLLSIFTWKIFPTAYIDGVGLTAFKRISEYVICAILLAAIIVFARKRKEFDPLVFKLIIASIAVTIASELSFTLYTSPNGFFNMMGHLLKIVAFYLIYLAIVETGLERPYDILFRKLKQREEALAVYRDHLEDEVAARTEALLESNVRLNQEVSERIRKERQLEETTGQLRALAVQQESVREEERRRIALEVHDKLGQELTALKLGLRSLSKHIPDDEGMKERIDQMSGSVDETIRTVRRISSELRPALLDDLGLAAALEWQLKAFGEQAMVETSLAASLDESYLNPATRVGLFRISQEALTNIARHSGASRVEVELSEQDGELLLAIRDNGRGAKSNELSNPSSMGILGMKERAYAFGGRVEITGEDGQGTSVMVKMPIG